MAETDPTRKDESGVAPIGMVIEEPSFPDIPGQEPTTRSDTPSSIVNIAAANMAQQESASRQDHAEDGKCGSSDTTTVNQDYFGTKSRPAQQQRRATERPKPSVRHSLLTGTRQPQQKRPTQPERRATITFDADTDSSDSSDEETLYSRTKSLGHADELTAQTTQKSRERRSRPFSRLRISNEHFNTKGRVSRADGRLKLSILEENLGSGYIAKALGTIVKKHGNDEDHGPETYNDIDATKIAPEDDEMEHNPARRVRLNIVIIIIGSRGDIQPFIRIAKILKDDYGHRVRLATHPAFKDFVEKDSGLEFFSVGGNPAELMAFMVKNPGLIPNIETIKEGEIGRRRAQMYEMFQGMWRACINATDDETDMTNVKMSK